MTDPRVKKLAHVLLHYSIGLKEKQIIKLHGDGCHGWNLGLRQYQVFIGRRPEEAGFVEKGAI